MLKARSIFALLALIALAGCQDRNTSGGEPEPTASTETVRFEVVGAVTDVEIDDLDEGATPSPTPTGDSDAGSEFDARLTIEIQSINDPAADLCGVERGDELVLVVGQQTNIVPVKALADLDEFDDQKISAGGTAEASPDGCLFTTESLRIVPADQGGSTPSPTTTGTPDGSESPTPSPTSTYSRVG